MEEIKDLSFKNFNSKRNNHFLFPKSIRGLIVGKSGCGKTTLLLNLQPKWLDYEKLFVFGKSLFQPEYKLLKHAFEKNVSKENLLSLFENNQTNCDGEIEYLLKNQFNPNPIESNFYELVEDVPDPKELNRVDNNLMIFDDLLLEKQNKCEDYYVRGRHSNVDCFYLAQNYFKLPRQTIRENANFICMFRQDKKNITHIYNDHVGGDMTIGEFKDFCSKCWLKKTRFFSYRFKQ